MLKSSRELASTSNFSTRSGMMRDTVSLNLFHSKETKTNSMMMLIDLILTMRKAEKKD